MKPRLIILSDLWGIQKSEWIKHYSESLNPYFEIKYYDCCQLGEVDKTDLSEKNLHSQFIRRGIKIAVEKLLDLETGNINILAFSIGGTIAWKAGLNGLNIKNLYAISSTRLRHETDKPNCYIKLFFGKKDNFKPNADWFEKMELKFEIIKNEGHQIYQNPDNILKVCEEIKTHYNRVDGPASKY
jgi:hypothetical protein